VSGRASTTGRGYGPSTARRSCRTSLGAIKWVVSRVGPPNTTHLAILSPPRSPSCLLSSLPLCLCLRATPFSTEGVREGASSPYSSYTNPTPTRAAIARPRGRFTACAHHLFAVVGRLVHLPDLHPVLPPQPTAPVHDHSREPTRLVDEGTG
jgi:hypothetical protein